MLRNFRSVFKGNQMPMTVVMGVVLVGMVAYLAPSGRDENAPDNVVARVYGREVLRRDLEQAKSEIMRRYGKQANMETMGPFLQSQALHQVVNQKLMEELAERHGIVVTDEETRLALQQRLREIPIFVNNGQLRSSTEINDILRENGQTLIQWEHQVRDQLRTQKLMEQAAAQVPVDAAWIEHENRVKTEKISYEFAALMPETAAIADPGDATLATFQKAAGARFQTGPRRVIQFVSVDQASLGDAIKVDESAVRAAYEAKRAQYRELEASHILFKASNDAEFAEALKKAEELRPKLIAGQDFNKTAEEVSEDPTAKGNQGKLGKFRSGSMVKPFEDAAAALKVGEISQPVKTQFGVHLIKLEGFSEKSFDDVQGELRAQLTRERFTQKAKEKLEQLRKRVGNSGDLGPAARAMSLNLQTSAAFANEPGAAIQGLTDAGSIPAEAFRMKVGQVSTVQRAGDRFVVFRVKEERGIAIPALGEIRAKVLNAWKQEEARKNALERAQAALKSGNLADLATPATKDAMTLQGLGELGQHPGIQKALLNTAVGALTPIVWTPDGQIWIARIKARTPAEALTFEKRRMIAREIQNATTQRILSAELEDLDLRGRQHSGLSSFWGRTNGIWINEDLTKKTIDDVPDMGGDF